MEKQDKDQSKRFIEKARELSADETGKKFERAFKKIVPRAKRRKPRADRAERNRAQD